MARAASTYQEDAEGRLAQQELLALEPPAWQCIPLAEGPGRLLMTRPIIPIWPVFFLAMLLARLIWGLSSTCPLLSSVTDAREAGESPADGDSCQRTRICILSSCTHICSVQTWTKISKLWAAWLKL